GAGPDAEEAGDATRSEHERAPEIRTGAAVGDLVAEGSIPVAPLELEPSRESILRCARLPLLVPLPPERHPGGEQYDPESEVEEPLARRERQRRAHQRPEHGEHLEEHPDLEVRD